MNTFPMSGPYYNDCPICKRHNALLDDMKGRIGIDFICRDCKTKFEADHKLSTYTIK